MPIQVIQLRRGLQSALAAFTPASGEPVWVTDTKELRVGDGSTAGGIPVVMDAALRPLLAGRRYTSHQRIYNTNLAASIGSSAIYYQPFYVGHEVNCVGIGIQVEVAQAGGGARLAIYDSGADAMPGSLVVETAALDCSTTGVKPTTIDEDLRVGLYWLASRANDATITFRCIDKTTLLDAFGWKASFANLGAAHSLLTEAGSYGAFPSTATTTGTGSASLDPPIVYLEF